MKIAFRRNGGIYRNAICVGWIEPDEDDGSRPFWRVRHTPASGKPGVVGEYERLSEAKTAARAALEDAK